MDVKEKIKDYYVLSSIDHADLISENVDIADYKKSKDKTSCTITICGKRQAWEIEEDKELSFEEMKALAIEVVEEIKRIHDEFEAPGKLRESAKIEKEVIGKVDPEKNKEIDELTKDAMPMKRQDPEVRVKKKGFVRGVVVKRKDAFGKDCGYGILTGEYESIQFSGDENMALKMTDGSSFNEKHCELITDVNKEIMRYVSEEQQRIQMEANMFCDTIQNFMSKIIYEA